MPSANTSGPILDAAREVFAAEGLEGASLRAIATRADIRGGALFPFRLQGSDLCRGAADSLTRARCRGRPGGRQDERPEAEAAGSAMAFFRYYVEHPGDLDLGFYLLRGGMKPAGLGRARDEELNAALEAALHRSQRPPRRSAHRGTRPTC